MVAVSRGMLYFIAVFSFAFVMGVLRTLVVAPRVGELVAVGIELPIVLIASWFVARRLLRRHPLPLPQRLVMGGVAFLLLMASEALLSFLMRGEGVAEWAASLVVLPGLLGLLGQVGFALVPALAGRSGSANPELSGSRNG